MIYFLTKSIIHLALKGFFRKIRVVGLEHMPLSEPAIIIANHPSALIDPLILSIIIPRKLHFLAGAEYFGKGFKAWLLREQYNMIPVYRKQKVSDKRMENDHADNSEMFSECYECLQNNGAFIIFPEGSSVSENRVREFKTGTARILTGFTSVHPDKEVNVIPVGLNYENPHRFKSDVLVKVGPPVPVEQSLLQDGNSDAIKEITLRMEESLQEQVFHIGDYRLNPLVSNIYQLTGHVPDLEDDSARSTFNRRKKIIEAVDYFNQTAPEKVQSLKDQIDQYFQKIEELGIKHFILDESAISFSPKETFQVILFFPVFILGLVGNLLPYLLTRLIYRIKYRPRLQKGESKKSINPAFSATISFAIGTILFLIWFIGISILVGVVTSSWIGGIASFITLYLLGQFSTWYKSLAEKVLEKWKVRSMMKRQPQKVKELIQLHGHILKELNRYQQEYEQVRSG